MTYHEKNKVHVGYRDSSVLLSRYVEHPINASILRRVMPLVFVALSSDRYGCASSPSASSTFVCRLRISPQPHLLVPRIDPITLNMLRAAARAAMRLPATQSMRALSTNPSDLLPPLKVAVTGAAGQIGYALVMRIARYVLLFSALATCAQL